MNTVIGVGNVLLSDDGVGVHTVQILNTHLKNNSDVTCIDAGTLSYELLDWLVESDAVLIVDAADMSEPAGTVKTFIDDEIENYFRQAPSRTVHQICIRDALNTAKILYERPKRCALIGIQPSDLSWGNSLSGTLTSNMPTIIDAVLNTLSGWGAQIDPLVSEQAREGSIL